MEECRTGRREKKSISFPNFEKKNVPFVKQRIKVDHFISLKPVKKKLFDLARKYQLPYWVMLEIIFETMTPWWMSPLRPVHSSCSARETKRISATAIRLGSGGRSQATGSDSTRLAFFATFFFVCFVCLFFNERKSNHKNQWMIEGKISDRESWLATVSDQSEPNYQLTRETNGSQLAPFHVRP